jgi:hypothetical protein
MSNDVVFRIKPRVKKESIPIMQTFAAPYSYIHPQAVTATNMNPTFPPQFFSGSQLLSLYNVPAIKPESNKKQVKIAVVVAYTYPGLLADLKTFWQNNVNFGPNSTPPLVNIRTMPGATVNTEWAQEECLDVQMVCVMNPNASIWVVEAASANAPDLLAALNYTNTVIQADVVSLSWGGNDSASLSKYNNSFTNTNTCYCAASGDANVVSWPSVLSNCISVGGTTMLWTPNSSTPRTEYSWSSGGCGYSSTVKQPDYQKNVPGIANNNFRAIPDVSLVANMNTGVYVVYKGQWFSYGGTSAATPLFAGMLSIAIQQRYNNGKGPLTTVYSTTPNSIPLSNVTPSNNVQKYLYKTIFPNPTKYANDFYDIKIGNNQGSIGGSSTGLTNFVTGSGFDIPTGLGSPNCANLCADLLNI